MDNKAKRYLVPVVFEKEEKNVELKVNESSINEDTMESVDVHNSGRTYACIIKEDKDSDLESSLQNCGFDICYSKDGRHLPDHIPDGCSIIFVCEEFKGKIFDYLMKHKYRIVGPPCIHHCSAHNSKSLIERKRPVYSCTMVDTVVCLTGFRDKEHVNDLCNMIHWMSGSIRNKVSSAVTHVISHNVLGAKYKNAVSFGINIMSEEWIYKCWESRHDLQVKASDPHLMKHKQLPFVGCVISLHGFTEVETKHIKEICEVNGGQNCEIDDDEMTHLVIANGVNPSDIPSHIPSRVHIVKQQWFWESIQIEACADEAMYYPKECRRKRRSLHNASSASIISMDSLLEASLVSLSSPIHRAPICLTQKKLSSLATSSATSTPSGTPGPTSNKEDIARHHIASELLQTEKNFVKILNLIVQEFKNPMEAPDQRGGPILNSEEMKSIFGNIPDILSVHTKIMASLDAQLSQWDTKCCIGSVLLEQADELLRVYPPFINYFELTKETLARCDRSYPRFHAFLKFNESRQECGRQSLAELLITPVQRIPRIILLLQDLLKHTDCSHPDHKPLNDAVESLKKVMTHINEDKRKTEGQMHMFEMMSNIEDCPANVLSSHRSFVTKLEVSELNQVTGKGSKTLFITLFLFSDSMEIAKRRQSHTFSMKGSYKPYRHLEFLPYSNIRTIVDFPDCEDIVNAFGLLVRYPEDPQERLLAFKLSGDEKTKNDVITMLAELLAKTNFTTISDDFISRVSSDVLNSLARPTGDSSTLKKALTGGFKGVTKKVKRTISARSTRKPFTPVNDGHSLEPMEESPNPNESDMNTSSCSMAQFTVTPVSALRAPPAKRQALGYSQSFSTLDLTQVGNEQD